MLLFYVWARKYGSLMVGEAPPTASPLSRGRSFLVRRDDSTCVQLHHAKDAIYTHEKLDAMPPPRDELPSTSTCISISFLEILLGIIIHILLNYLLIHTASPSYPPVCQTIDSEL